MSWALQKALLFNKELAASFSECTAFYGWFPWGLLLAEQTKISPCHFQNNHVVLTHKVGYVEATSAVFF